MFGSQHPTTRLAALGSGTRTRAPAGHRPVRTRTVSVTTPAGAARGPNGSRRTTITLDGAARAPG